MASPSRAIFVGFILAFSLCFSPSLSLSLSLCRQHRTKNWKLFLILWSPFSIDSIEDLVEVEAKGKRKIET